MYKQLVYSYKQNDHDVSDIIRGKIQTIEEFLGIKEMFKRVEEIETSVKTEEERLNNLSKGAK